MVLVVMVDGDWWRWFSVRIFYSRNRSVCLGVPLATHTDTNFASLTINSSTFGIVSLHTHTLAVRSDQYNFTLLASFSCTCTQFSWSHTLRAIRHGCRVSWQSKIKSQIFQFRSISFQFWWALERSGSKQFVCTKSNWIYGVRIQLRKKNVIC